MNTVAGIAPSNPPVRRLPPWTMLWVSLVSMSFAAWTPAWAGSCRDAAQPLREALKARDVDAARRHFEAVESKFGCSDDYRRKAARAVSNLHANVVLERLEKGADLASQRAMLERGLEFARTWHTLALLGDAAHEEKDYHGAAGLYQEALVVINNETETPRAPPRSEIERIHRRAWQSRMLAERFVAAPVNRAGNPDGLAAPSIRGHKVEIVPIPITFRFDSDEFDDLGRRYAEEMAEHLMQQHPARVVFSAHTDPQGDAPYNLDLSRRRGEAVVEFLQARLSDKDVNVEVEMIPKGESEPIPFDLEGYSQEERMRMHRRVELVR